MIGRRGVRDLTAVRTLVPFAVLAGAVLLLALYAWPGIMTFDSFDQLREGREGSYTDGHPPAMAAFWGRVDTLIAGPAGMYLIQITVFVAGLYALLRWTFAPQRAAWLTFAIAVFPPVLAPMGVIWKDALMAAFLVLGLAGIGHGRRSIRIAALGAFFVATAVRYNTPAATLPLVVLLFQWAPTPATWPGRIRRYAIATAAWITITGAAFAINGALTDKPMHLWHSSTALHDITGVLAYVDDDLPDAELGPILAGSRPLIDRDYHATLRARYKPTDFAHLILGPERIWDLPILGDRAAPPEQRAGVAHAWKELVSRFPGAYVTHRLAVFGKILGFGDKSPGVMVMTKRGQHKDLAQRFGVSADDWWVQNWIQRRIEKVAHRTPLFRGWFYLVLSLLLLPFAWRQRDVLAILLSGLGLEASLFPLAGTPDFRYSHWLALTTIVAAVLLIARRYRATRVIQAPPIAAGPAAQAD
ncbi:MAG: hypothetical protein H0T89_14360 [Deltaproteobacteria bacterium]|nr:hypothetical protein [Deltaproteobacteria bacterium]MDQ3296071.1 hypothetical protein [Myxococcota bacterium]